VEAYRNAVESSLIIASFTADVIQRSEHLSLLIKPTLSIVAFERIGWDWSDYKSWSKKQLKKQICFVVPSSVRGAPILRFAFVNPGTPEAIVDEILLSLE
jgi:glutamate/tyrosine decarboxylase-like PLP-dependent enzyme